MLVGSCRVERTIITHLKSYVVAGNICNTQLPPSTGAKLLCDPRGYIDRFFGHIFLRGKNRSRNQTENQNQDQNEGHRFAQCFHYSFFFTDSFCRLGISTNIQ